MTLVDFIGWCLNNSVPLDTDILLHHPGGYDEFRIKEYSRKHSCIVVEGTG